MNETLWTVFFSRQSSDEIEELDVWALLPSDAERFAVETIDEPIDVLDVLEAESGNREPK